jgi:ferric-chelate reductase [NAD(P)H]
MNNISQEIPPNLNNPIDFAALLKIQYGVYVISTKAGEKCNAQIATTVFQVTSKPINIALCLSKNTYTHELILQSNIVGVSILEQNTPLKFIGQFGFKCGRNCDKFSNIEYKNGQSGCPLVLTNSLVILEGKITKTLDIGTHTLFVANVSNAEKIKDGNALTYEYYHNVIKGKSPENAPTYISK